MIDAVFLHEDGYKFNEVYVDGKRKAHTQFFSALRKKGSTFLHAMDVNRAYVIYPSNLPDYQRAVNS